MVRNNASATFDPVDRDRAVTRKIVTVFARWVTGTLLLLLMVPRLACCLDITPFYTQNQSPLIQIYGLPPAGSAHLLDRGEREGTLAGDLASNYARERNGRESVLLDGESYRTTLALRFGLARGVEGTIDLPFTGQGGGFLDNFIIGWHNFFNLPGRGRAEAPRGRLDYRYTSDGITRLAVTESSFGLGDLRLGGGVQLIRPEPAAPGALALRFSLKLPTGDSDRLHGSGSTDLALWLSGSDDYRLSWGHATLFGAAGGMAMTRGQVLSDQQRPLVAFGSLGCGWSPADWIAFKLQLSSHTPFYDKSDLRALDATALQLLIGGTLGLAPGTDLDIGVSEDLTVNTSPDVAFHLAVKHRF